MISKKNLLRKSEIYAIVDTSVCERANIPVLVRQLLNSHIGIIQLRDKTPDFTKRFQAARLLKRLIGRRALFIINDSPEICLLLDADGLHLGQGDMALACARKIVGNKIVGISCHTFNQARLAQKQGADYIGFGPIFSTPLKPKTQAVGIQPLLKLQKTFRIPVFAIGGISPRNLAALRPGTVRRGAACRALYATKNVRAAVKQLKAFLSPQ